MREGHVLSTAASNRIRNPEFAVFILLFTLSLLLSGSFKTIIIVSTPVWPSHPPLSDSRSAVFVQHTTERRGAKPIWCQVGSARSTLLAFTSPACTTRLVQRLMQRPFAQTTPRAFISLETREAAAVAGAGAVALAVDTEVAGRRVLRRRLQPRGNLGGRVAAVVWKPEAAATRPGSGLCAHAAFAGTAAEPEISAGLLGGFATGKDFLELSAKAGHAKNPIADGVGRWGQRVAGEGAALADNFVGDFGACRAVEVVWGCRNVGCGQRRGE